LAKALFVDELEIATGIKAQLSQKWQESRIQMVTSL
jgi:hypothetical protein